MRINIKTFLLTLGVVAFVAIGSRAADEIITQVYLKGEKSYSKVEENPASLNITWNGRGISHANVITGTTAYVALFPNTVATNGIAYIRNLSTNTTWIISFNAGTNEHLRVKAGEFSLMRLSTTITLPEIMGKGGATNTEIKTVILED